MKKVIVLGNGPAGLMAAQAAYMRGVETIEIVSESTKPSIISGAQYLDRHIPGVTDPAAADSYVTFYKKGKREGYAEKIYGNDQAPTSWDKYEPLVQYPLWYLREAYKQLWMRFERRMSQGRVDANYIAALLDTNYDLVISTIPLPTICYNPTHEFESQPVVIYDGIPPVGKKLSFLAQAPMKDNFIVYSGKRKDPWYRCSRICGLDSTEYPRKADMQPDPEARYINKPLRTTCDCWDWPQGQRMLLAGRFGMWDKNQLVSSAFERVTDAL